MRQRLDAELLKQRPHDAEEPGRPRLAVDARGRGVVAWSTSGQPYAARLQWLTSGKGVTRPRKHGSRACPPFPR